MATRTIALHRRIGVAVAGLGLAVLSISPAAAAQRTTSDEGVAPSDSISAYLRILQANQFDVAEDEQDEMDAAIEDAQQELEAAEEAEDGPDDEDTQDEDADTETVKSAPKHHDSRDAVENDQGENEDANDDDQGENEDANDDDQGDQGDSDSGDQSQDDGGSGGDQSDD